MSAQLHGTWRWIKQIDRDGKEDATRQAMPHEYTFNPDGSASFNLPGGPKLPMRWKIVDGRLRIGGARGEKGQGTLRFEMPDPNTLILFDKHERQGVFERVPDEEQKESWVVKFARVGKGVVYEDSKRTIRFDAVLQDGRWQIHTHRWTDAGGNVHDRTEEIQSVIVPRVVNYLHMGGWKGRVEIVAQPPR
jgi:hypothetical protein